MSGSLWMSINVPNFLSAIMPKRKSGSTSNRGKGKASKRQKEQTAKEVTSPTNPDLAPVPPNQAANGVAQPATGEPVILSQNQIVTGQDAFPTGGQVMVSSQDMQGKALGTQPSASGGGSFRVQCSQDQNVLTDISSQMGTALFLPQPGGVWERAYRGGTCFRIARHSKWGDFWSPIVQRGGPSGSKRSISDERKDMERGICSFGLHDCGQTNNIGYTFMVIPAGGFKLSGPASAGLQRRKLETLVLGRMPLLFSWGFISRSMLIGPKSCWNTWKQFGLMPKVLATLLGLVTTGNSEQGRKGIPVVLGQLSIWRHMHECWWVQVQVVHSQG